MYKYRCTVQNCHDLAKNIITLLVIYCLNSGWKIIVVRLPLTTSEPILRHGQKVLTQSYYYQLKPSLQLLLSKKLAPTSTYLWSAEYLRWVFSPLIIYWGWSAADSWFAQSFFLEEISSTPWCWTFVAVPYLYYLYSTAFRLFESQQIFSDCSWTIVTRTWMYRIFFLRGIRWENNKVTWSHGAGRNSLPYN